MVYRRQDFTATFVTAKNTALAVSITYNTEEICNIIHGEWLARGAAPDVEYLSTNSREKTEHAKTLFWALPGSGRDGSEFIGELYDQGVRNFITQKNISLKGIKKANIVYVEDSLMALQTLAAFHRKKFKGLHVIGITGSNGKTIVKDWMAELLSTHFKVVRSPRSYNSQIGVPLSLLQIRKEHQVGVFEAGISRPGEMERLAGMILPNTGIFTNIGSAHDEGFTDRMQKIREKLHLFHQSDSLVYPGDVSEISNAIKQYDFKPETRLLSCGKIKTDFQYTIHTVKTQTHIRISFAGQDYPIRIPFTDQASVENAINAFCGIMASGKFKADMLKGFENLHPVSMRMELKPGRNHCRIINDSYSNDLQSLEVAVSFLKQQSHLQSTIILSDLLQSGMPSEELYGRVADILARYKIYRLIGVGNEIMAARKMFKGIREKDFFPSTQSFLAALPSYIFQDEAILIKGARKFSFEKISALLEAQLHQTVLSVNLSNLSHNIRFYKSLLQPGTKIMTMVKAFAYGSGIEQIGSLLQHTKVDYLTVAYTDEGVALREAGITLPVMVLNIEAESFENIVRYDLEPEIFSFETLAAFTSYLKHRKLKSYPVHLKIDTGMHRLGFGKKEIPALIRALSVNQMIKIKSVFSHLSSSDNPAHDDFTKEQFRLFKSIAAKIRKAMGYPFDCHLANTSAISRFPAMQMNMVRLGIGMYGIDSNPLVAKQLKVVNRLTTTISQIKTVKEGEVVGYGMQRVTEDKLIATVRIGYADGYPRILGNGKGRMMAGGKMVPTVGNICMDMTMLDITGLHGLKEDDQVLVFGEGLPVEKVAKWASTIPYEIFTGISPRVRRVYFEE